MRNTRAISWINTARREFEDFPPDVQREALRALTVAAGGGKADKAKPFKGVEGGVFEIALKYRGDAFRVLYALQIAAAVVVIYVFKKKSKTGIKTPQHEVEVIRQRIKRLKEGL